MCVKPAQASATFVIKKLPTEISLKGSRHVHYTKSLKSEERVLERVNRGSCGGGR